MNNSIRKLMRKRNHIHRKAVKTQNPHHYQKYRDLRNKVIAEIRASRNRFNKKKKFWPDIYIPPGKWWIIVKSPSKQNNKKQINCTITIFKSYVHPMEKANLLNEHFANVLLIMNHVSDCMDQGLQIFSPGS